MFPATKHIIPCTLLFCLVQTARSQMEEVHGQASGWLTANPQSSSAAQLGLRYIPDFLAERTLGNGLDADVELSLNTFASARYEKHQLASYDWSVQLYRAWFRISADRFEARVGLQKINFGSAMFFRPLMWFDRIDPRDPLQLTAGVYGVLARYYFLNNTNFWLWGLYGNNDTKGWELAPTETNTLEYGGRAQSRLWIGEVAFSYHHRRADLSLLTPISNVAGSLNVPEDRFGLDGKWDIGIGVWFEAALVHQETDILNLKYQRQWTIGTDYTFAAGNGLYVATEYFRSENPTEPFASSAGRDFSALSMNYPISLVDRLSCILYRDWNSQQWYRLATWQRTYDDWSFYVLGFWNPETMQIDRSQAGANAFAGTGFQIMIVFNH